MEHEMRARDTVSIGEDITPPLPPLACSLYDTSVPTHCSSCFRSLSTHPIDNATFVAYCSAQCAAADSPLHFSSAENSLFLLLNSPVPIWPHGDCADLRVSLRLLRRLELVSFFPHPPLAYRIAGFMTNRENLADAKDHLDCENFSRVRDGARLIAKARAMRDGREFSGDCEVEEAVLCLVLTNAVEVHVSGDDGVGLGIGVGVYDNRFSWMNHSCSPNSCYRFKMFSVDVAACENDMSRITPFCSGIQVEDDVPLQYWNKSEGCRNFGPRMVVRSIKMIKRGEEVTVTYIDLLQPMMARQSELWHKYKFICSCRRCAALSPQYVDNALQETFSINLHSETTSLNSRNEGVEKLRDYIDSVTSAFMSTGNSVICCTKIENLLSFGLISGGSESKEGSSVSDFRLSPIHQLSLNAYTTLSSAHGIRAATLINENKVEAYKATRISAGYSLLRAGSVNHLFLSEPSLIVSAATFWTSAGESLLSLARSSVWDSSTNWLAGNPTANCDDCCCLVDTFEVCSCCPGAQEEEFAKRCHDMLKCISGITSKSIVWIFLAQGCHFLRGIEDPINFDWLGSLRDFNVWQYHSEVTDSKLCSSNRNEFGFVKGSDDDDDIRMSVFQLGAHCLVFGGFLSVVCYGPDSCRIDYMKNLLRSS